MSSEDTAIKAERQLRSELGRTPTLDEIAARMRWLEGRAPLSRRIAGRLLRTPLGRLARPLVRARRIARASRFYRPLIRAGGICFDIGANRGMRTACFRRIGLRVVAVEPLEINILALNRAFKSDPHVTIVPVGLASAPGRRTIRYNPSHSDIASMSDAWIACARRLPRLADPAYNWKDSATVELTTLNALIAAYGVPDFCKIDVEGFELEVLSGLDLPIPALSFEYTPGFIANAAACIARLESLARYEYNISTEESLRLRAKRWLGPSEVLALAASYPEPGDIYARCLRGT